MQRRLSAASCLMVQTTSSRVLTQGRRFMAIRPTSRAAVHGTRLPATETLDKEEVEAEIQKGKEEKERRRKEVEKKVDSQLINRAQVPNSPQ